VLTYYDVWTRDREAWTAFLPWLASRGFHVVSPVSGYLPPGTLEGGLAFAPTGVLFRVSGKE
jgi:hypothetical protein